VAWALPCCQNYAPTNCFLGDFAKGIKRAIKKNQITPDIFDATALKRPNKIAVCSADDLVKYTFSELRDLINRIGNIFYDLGYRKDDVIVLYMENRPEYVAFWLALSKLGVITSLVNFNLRKESLEHCIKVAGAKGIIFSQETEGIFNLPCWPILHRSLFDAGTFHATANYAKHNKSYRPLIISHK